MKRLFVQGSRTAPQDVVNAVLMIVRLLGMHCLLGSKSTIAEAIKDSGLPCSSLKMQVDSSPEGDVIDGIGCGDMVAPAAQALADADPVFAEEGALDNVGWGFRLGAYLGCHAAIFTQGGWGTLAHLIPLLAFNAKTSGPQVQIFLLGWSDEAIDGLCQMAGIDTAVLFTNLGALTHSVEELESESVRAFVVRHLCDEFEDVDEDDEWPEDNEEARLDAQSEHNEGG